jgi:hypothetical protein
VIALQLGPVKRLAPSLARFEVALFVRFPEGDLSQSPGSRSAPWEKSRNLIYPNGVASTGDVPSDATLSV